MGKRHPNHRLVKIHRNYTVEEIASLFGAHKNTVRRWIKDGLTPTDTKRPMLFLGHHLANFLKSRRAEKKQTCKAGELYCVRCRAPRVPAGYMADFSLVTEKVGNLIGICPECDAIMNRRVSLSKIGKLRGEMDIRFPVGLENLNETTNPSVNCDFKEERANHENAPSGQ